MPIGWRYPAGPFKADASSGVRQTLCHLFSNTGKDAGGFLVWIFKVFVIGLLIGLGVPFWFDVARKLSQVRQARSEAKGRRISRLRPLVSRLQRQPSTGS